MKNKISRRNMVRILLVSLLLSTIITVIVMFLFVPVRVTGGEAGINEIRLMPFDSQLLTSSEPESNLDTPLSPKIAIVPDMIYYDLEKGLYAAEGIVVFLLSFLISVCVKVRKKMSNDSP